MKNSGTTRGFGDPLIMSTNEINRFVAWARQVSTGKKLICRFHITESKKQFYDNADFAHFNLQSSAPEWIIKGTTGHGIKSKRRRSSSVPCLNCFAINNKFYKALRDLSHEENRKFQFGLVLDKRELARQFNLIDVSTEIPHPPPPPNKCHHYDIPSKRRGVLSPFNYCDVVRIEIPRSGIGGKPITEINLESILALLTKFQDGSWVYNQLQQKEMTEIKLFCPL